MRDEPDLVSLLYRADWTRLSLSAEVSVTRDRDLWRSPFDDGPPPRERGGGLSGPWSAPWFAPWLGPPRMPEDEDLDESGEPDGRGHHNQGGVPACHGGQDASGK